MTIVQDFSVKYDGRGCLFEISVETDAEHEAIMRRIGRTVGGPNLNAYMSALKRLRRSNGDLLDGYLITVVVNTDEDYEVVGKRLGEAVGGPRTKSYTVAVAELLPHQVAGWLRGMAESMKAHLVSGKPLVKVR